MSQAEDETFMQMAIDLALRGQGFVEPNPMVGCVLVKNGEVIGRGWHQNFGGPHAEINALNSVNLQHGSNSHADANLANRDSTAALNLTGCTAFVTLEPCSHVGKTGPCVQALIDAGVARVVMGVIDPNPLVAGKGAAQLQAVGIDVDSGVLENICQDVLRPYLKWMQQKTPWMIAKWAMTLDGKIATASRDSQWITNPDSRAIVHSIRARVDGVLVGIETAIADDPMLNARPSGAREATRIIVDSTARIPLESKLVQTANQIPTLIAVGPAASPARCDELKRFGCRVFQSQHQEPNQRLMDLLEHLAGQGMTNVLVEGGGQLLGSLNDLEQIDEVHAFVGPKLLGGQLALSPMGGTGKPLMQNARNVTITEVRQIGSDVYVQGRISTNKKRT